MEKNKKKRNIIIVFSSLIGVMVLLIVLNMIMDKITEIPIGEIVNKSSTAPTVEYNYKFYEPDYEYNILEDTEYLDKNRYIEYTEGAVSVTIADGNFKMFGKPLEFFDEYFNTAVNGDHNKYNTFFTESYYKENKIDKAYESFTMQRIYNINVEILQQSMLETADNYGNMIYLFKVSYMIMKNDGTFRNDMGSDGAVPLLFEIIYNYNDDRCYINNISRYNILLIE